MSKEDKKQRAQHTGSVAPEDAELSTWLHRLWARGEPPERIELWQVFGGKHPARGEMIFHEDFKPNEKLDVEQVNKLANEICGAAQHDCDCARRGERNYQIAVIDKNRRATPLTRGHGPIMPKRQYLQQGGGGEDEDDIMLDGRSLSLAYIKEGFAQTRWDKERNDRVLGEMLVLQDSIIKEQRVWGEQLMGKVMSFFDALQQAQDRSLDREVIREKEKFKISLWRDGARTVRNLVPGLFAAAQEGNGTKALGSANGSNSSGEQSKPPDHGPSTERTLIDGFLNDIEEAQLAIPLFGDYEIRADGKMYQIEGKSGIFSPEQFAIMAAVRNGYVSTDALDRLVPCDNPCTNNPAHQKHGHANAITIEQINKAGDAGVTEGMGIAILEIVGLRRSKMAALNTDTKPPTTPETTSPQ